MEVRTAAALVGVDSPHRAQLCLYIAPPLPPPQRGPQAAFPFSDGRLRQGLGPAAHSPDCASLAAAVLEVEARATAAARGLSPAEAAAEEDSDRLEDDDADAPALFPCSAPALATALAPAKLWAPLWAVMAASRVLLEKVPLEGPRRYFWAALYSSLGPLTPPLHVP